ncbi:DUF1283 family protein [Enterobacter ludwigii]|uniref:DUF1283 family protein n=1 Tax=Enterobacteriaceae TaxID=543 RepID=UPI001BD36C9B|nr:DUF1283 family protein [Enterobacter ludwigii]EHN8908267.1 DUF1283 family protein [Enterobacter hormaechei]WGA07141.1 DUF1283 family protein [Enterobacter ludwigii]
MNMRFGKRIYLAAMLSGVVMFTASVQAETSRLTIESGDNAESRQQAAMDKEQWNDTRSLRQKVNKRAEAEWDKTDAAFDDRDNCEKSPNVNAYWEPDTRRCLDRITGHVITP